MREPTQGTVKRDRGDGFSVTLETTAREIVHACDVAIAGERSQVFGGDGLGHWDVRRAIQIMRALGFSKPLNLSIPFEERVEMAHVSPLDDDCVAKWAQAPITEPLIFLDMAEVEHSKADEARLMLIDGHHRMMATVLRRQVELPAFALAAQWRPFIEVVEIRETTRFAKMPRAKVHEAIARVEGRG